MESQTDPPPVRVTKAGSSKLQIEIRTPEGCLEGELDLPKRMMGLTELAYTLVQISSQIAELVSQSAAKRGQPVTCRAGCGACCRQLVALSPPEALMISNLVETLPEPRRSRVRERFDEATRRLDELGILGRLERVVDLTELAEDDPRIHRDYFLAGVPCPFLEDESCSIHALRPSVCREYIVSSPAELCRDPFRNRIAGLSLSTKIYKALAKSSAALLKRPVRYVPLVLALDWAAKNDDLQRSRWESTGLVEATLLLLGEMLEKEEEEKKTEPSPSQA
jgi:Fe-S-cluster containining protein